MASHEFYRSADSSRHTLQLSSITMEDRRSSESTHRSSDSATIVAPDTPYTFKSDAAPWQDEKSLEDKVESGLLSTPPHNDSFRFPRSIRELLGYDLESPKLRSTAWLDGLRGLAALEVFIFHYCDGWFNHSFGYGERGPLDKVWWRLPFIRSIYASGDTAVCVFFAISGYVLTYNMLRLLKQSRHEELYASLTSAVFRRGIRLYLPVIVLSFTLMIMSRIGFPKPAGYADAPTMFLELRRWFWNIVHLLMPLRYPDRWNELMNFYDGSISWTIPLEYYGSIIVYSTTLLLSRTKKMKLRMALVSMFTFTSFLKDDWIAAQFLLGMLFAEYQLDQETRNVTSHSRLRRVLPWVIFIFGIQLSGIPLPHLDAPHTLSHRPGYDWISHPLAWIGAYEDRQADRYLNCLAGIAILIGVGETPQLKKMMETRFVQYLGKISFGLYLCHIFTHAYLRKLDSYYLILVGLGPEVPQHGSSDLRLFLAYCMMMTVSIMVNFTVGSLFERYLDRPAVKAAKRFEQWCLSLE